MTSLQNTQFPRYLNNLIKRYKSSLKSSLKTFEINNESWESRAAELLKEPSEYDICSVFVNVCKPVSQCVPVNQATQSHVYELTASIHVATFSQGLLGPCIYRFFLFRFQICERKTDNEFLFRFSFSNLRTKNEKRIPFSFFVFKSEVRKTKNEFVFRFSFSKVK